MNPSDASQTAEMSKLMKGAFVAEIRGATPIRDGRMCLMFDKTNGEVVRLEIGVGSAVWLFNSLEEKISPITNIDESIVQLQKMKKCLEDDAAMRELKAKASRESSLPGHPEGSSLPDPHR